MTTCDLSLIRLPKGRRQIETLRYYENPAGIEGLKVKFPSFAGGLDMIGEFHGWARENDLKVHVPDHVTYAVACKRAHLFDFWQRCYARQLMGAAEYLATGDKVLRAVKEKEIQQALALRGDLEGLNSRQLYGLIAYEY